jgi:hypothetical protein
MYSRRDFGKIALAGAPVAMAWGATNNSTVNGVSLGTITYSFRDLPRTPGQDNIDAIIQALQFCRIGDIELFSPNMEPAGQPLPPEPPTPYGMPRTARPPRTEAQNALNRANREALRKWRIETPAAHYQDVRQKFDAAGIRLFALTIGFNDSFTDEEIDACFRQATALGVQTIASSTSPAMCPRLAPFADRHKMKVAVHGYSVLNDPNRFGSPESFAKALALSPYFRINLDIGHFAAANLDPVAFIRENHEQITQRTLRRWRYAHQTRPRPAQGKEVSDSGLRRIRIHRPTPFPGRSQTLHRLHAVRARVGQAYRPVPLI